MAPVARRHGGMMMLKIEPSTADEFDSALDLMQENMAPLLTGHGIAWDRSWHRKSYEGKQNYSIKIRGSWIGFVSLEFQSDCLFVHTLQLIPKAQGNIYGNMVLQWLKGQSRSQGLKNLACKTISGSSIVTLYQRLGFKVIGRDNILIELCMPLDC